MNCITNQGCRDSDYKHDEELDERPELVFLLLFLLPGHQFLSFKFLLLDLFFTSLTSAGIKAADSVTHGDSTKEPNCNIKNIHANHRFDTSAIIRSF